MTQEEMAILRIFEKIANRNQKTAFIVEIFSDDLFIVRGKCDDDGKPTVTLINPSLKDVIDMVY